ncbi:MAG: radical SAM protein [Candidatus Omnitrophota bacterium]
MSCSKYLEIKKNTHIPRFPSEGNIDITYRCNNNCLHCWLRIPADSKENKKELSFEEIKRIVNEARNMGCRKWTISGGEPMLRPDFPEIFNYITQNSLFYSLNTNGTLITPKIARLLKIKGVKMVALYGATAQIHDHITRTPGSFELTIKGFKYLKEAQAGFTVQLIPMKDNYHQFKDMVKLAENLSKSYRIGASWLYMSASGNLKKNKEITHQRLPPKEVVELDKPDLSYQGLFKTQQANCYQSNNNYLFSSCINSRRDFYVNPYGQISFCSFVKDPNLYYDFKKGSFRQAWEEFIPSLINKIKTTKEYKENCGACEIKDDCRWCPVYGYLEHRRFGAKVNYLCKIAGENRKFKDNWLKQHRRYFKIAGITIQVESDLPFKPDTFHSRFKHFEVSKPGKDIISIRHHFSLPDLSGNNLGRQIYRKAPWAIYKKGDSWLYLGILPGPKNKDIYQAVIFNSDHSRTKIFNDSKDYFLKGNLDSLTMLPTDQIILARIIADRQGCYLHSSGVNLNGKGLLFAGHSQAGKSTMANLLKEDAQILCDDRMIIRWHQIKGFEIHGTWNHGTIPDIANKSAPLKAVLFLEKAKSNRLIPLTNNHDKIRRILSCLIKPFVTADWWDKTLTLVEKISQEIPCYRIQFKKDKQIKELLKYI